jgi:hypothetical protein
MNLPHDAREQKFKTKKWIKPFFILDSLKTNIKFTLIIPDGSQR